MYERIRTQIKSLFVFLISASVCFSQGRQVAQRPAPARTGAPFLQQVKFYEETPYVTKVVLKNGMTVLVNEYRAQPVVSIQAYIPAGFSHEPLQNPGLARLLAAMVYRGTSDKNLGTFRWNAQALGGTLKSSTDYENTQFEIVVPSSQWKKALDIQADALLNPSLDPDALRLETNLVLDEARGALDNPSEFAREKL
jgi:predicted Zn-dependent peptidase